MFAVQELFRKSRSERAVQREPFRERCAERAVQRELFRESCSERAVWRELFRESCSERAAQRELFTESCSELVESATVSWKQHATIAWVSCHLGFSIAVVQPVPSCLPTITTS